MPRLKSNNSKEESKMTEKYDYQFFVPIKESFSLGNEFMIKGVAINSTTTRNGVTYTSEELMKAAHTLEGKPILKDHGNLIDNIIGKVKRAFFDNSIQAVIFEGKIHEPKYQEMIKDGRLSTVSIGAMVAEVEEGEQLIPHGIDFVELSLVAVPADPNASFAQAMMEKFEGKKSGNSIETLKEDVDKLRLGIDIVKAQRMIKTTRRS